MSYSTPAHVQLVTYSLLPASKSQQNVVHNSTALPAHEFLSLKENNRQRAGDIALAILAEDHLSTENDRDFFLSLLDVLSLSAYLKAIGQEMIEARYEDLALREEQESAEKREQKERGKAEKREQKERGKAEKREQKEREKAEKREQKEREKAEQPAADEASQMQNIGETV